MLGEESVAIKVDDMYRLLTISEALTERSKTWWPKHLQHDSSGCHLGFNGVEQLPGDISWIHKVRAVRARYDQQDPEG
jgi:hypothetical protein